MRIKRMVVSAGLALMAAAALAAATAAPALAAENGEAYAVYNSQEHSLVFERGTVPAETATTKVYTGFETAEYDFGTTPWAGVARTVATVSFKDTIKPSSTAYWFADFRNVASFDLGKLDTSQDTSMCSMFKTCIRLNNVDVTGLDTSKVTSMESMFDGCTNLGYLDVTHWDTSNVKTMYAMFLACYNLTYLDMSHWDTSKCTNMAVMFSDADHLCAINLTGVNTSSIESMHLMFFGCYQLTDLDLSSFTSEKIFDASATGFSGEYSFFGYSLGEREGWTRKLQRITTSDSYATFSDNTLPTQTADMVPDADGFWYDADGNSYKGQLPSNRACTYYGSPTMASKIDIANAQVELSSSTVAATGSELTPSVTVSLEGKTLQQGTDYTVTYFNNVYSGIATAAVYGTGAYRGDALGFFAIEGLERPASEDFDPQPDDPEPEPIAPTKVVVGKVIYKLNTAKGTAKVIGLNTKGKKAKIVSVAARLAGTGWSCKITGIAAKAFAGSKVTVLKVATKNLTKSGVKNSLKSSRVKTVKVAVKGNKKVKNSFKVLYKKYFSASNCGKAVKVG